MKKFVKISLITLLIVFVITFTSLGFYFSSMWTNAQKTALDVGKLSSPALAIEVFDSQNRPIEEANMFNGKFVKIEEVPLHVKNAFISIEDKDFYEHKGVNYKRIMKAVVNNLKSMNLKEGASTISQQLIKNTHLTSEKTFERKVREIALAQKLEKTFSKDEILEQYLNIIYFGNNCYGIESAANFYFSKQCKDLTIEEGAVLAGMIKSPAKYSPVSNKSNCLKRRNLVLKELEKDKKINLQQFMKSKETPVELHLSPRNENKLNSYSEASIDESCKILGLPAKQLALRGYKIHTYQNNEKQVLLNSALLKTDKGENDFAGIVLDNAKHAVVAYLGKSNYKILSAKRQPGSTIKPILVYAPALNEDIITPATQLLDEKTTISGYNPKNVGNNYKGYVSVREALSKSINIPAVKVLSYVGIDKAKAYASQLGIEFNEKDDSYALALGGMSYGTNIQALASSYSALARKGNFAPAKFVSYITDKNDKIVYVHSPIERTVLREDTSYLLTDMLRTSAQTGTARKLSNLEIDIASKTGTVGKGNSKENLDAWNVSYTASQTCAVWIGNLDNTPINIVGGGAPTEIAKLYFESSHDESKFEMPSCIVEMPIDATELDENHHVVLANSFIPERYIKKELFSRFNLPEEVSKKFTQIEKPEYKVKTENGKAVWTLKTKNYIIYDIYRDSVSNENLAKTITNESGKLSFEIDITKNKEKFIIVSSYLSGDKSLSNFEEVELYTKQTSPIIKDKWFI